MDKARSKGVILKAWDGSLDGNAPAFQLCGMIAAEMRRKQA
jgi:hypothetical protein